MTSVTFYSSESAALERQSDVDESVTFDQVWSEQQRELCTKWIEENSYKKVCLQFPDNYLVHSTKISDDLKNKTDAKCFILADTSYGSCCVDEIAAAHVGSDCIIHFGDACKSKVSRLPVLYVFPHFSFDWNDFIEKVKVKFSSDSEVFVHFDIPYQYLLADKYKDELEKVRSNVKNLWVCDSFPNNRNADSEGEPIRLFIGRDSQTFFNLSMTIKASKWFIYDPTQSTLSEVQPTTTNWIKRRYYYIEKCKDAQTLGLVVATLTASGYLDVVKHIQEMARSRGIKTHIISVGRINPAKLANFMEIDCFVLIGCPFNNLHTCRDFFKPIVSVFEAEMALNPAWRMKMPDKYCTDFSDILPGGDCHIEFKAEDVEGNDVSLVTGKMRSVQVKSEFNGNTNGVLCERTNYQIMLANGGSAYDDRSWRGLEQNLGETEPAKLEPGLSGIPISYQ